MGLVGGLVNAFAILGTFGGILVDAFRSKDDEFFYAALIHVVNVAFHSFALYFLITALGDEDRPALPTVIAWTVTTVAALLLYWNWMLS